MIHGIYKEIVFPFVSQKSLIDPREVLVTCGNQSDPRIRLGVEVAQALTLIFRSDGSNRQNRGVNLTVIEINTTAADVSEYVLYIMYT